jgi:hypothetical protein
MERLTWKQGNYRTHYGSAGGIELFIISHRTVRGGADWLMQTRLPGAANAAESDDIDALKAEAEQVLADWLERVGGKAD